MDERGMVRYDERGMMTRFLCLAVRNQAIIMCGGYRYYRRTVTVLVFFAMMGTFRIFTHAHFLFSSSPTAINSFIIHPPRKEYTMTWQ